MLRLAVLRLAVAGGVVGCPGAGKQWIEDPKQGASRIK